MKTKELQTIWWEYLSTAERLLRSLHEQTAAIMLRDVERIERLQPELESLLEQLVQVDEKAVACARKLTSELNVPNNFKSLVEALDEGEAKSVHALANRVKASAQTVQSVIEKNQNLIENELAFVAGSLHLLAKIVENREGDYGIRTHAAVLIDQRT
ncbi:MAG TPA: flagellar export chaperone FlgN [Fimbriimonadales bacterium]|nr:flagellar export chaperone FlgN [Fimbriimonadales bacterium]